LDRDRRAAAAVAPPAAPETTGSIAAPASGDPKPGAKPPIVEGWAIRKVYDGAALIEVAAVASAGHVVTEVLDAVERLVWSVGGTEVVATHRWWSEAED